MRPVAPWLIALGLALLALWPAFCSEPPAPITEECAAAQIRHEAGRASRVAVLRACGR